MIKVLYTDSDRVLGVLGLTSEDISDEFFAARDLPRTLSVALYPWLPNHATYFVPDTNTGTATADAVFNSDCLVLYCTNFCAAKVARAILAIMVKETDGENEYNRLPNADLRKLAEDADSLAGYYRETLLSAIKSTLAATVVSQSTIVTPSYDPVTG